MEIPSPEILFGSIKSVGISFPSGIKSDVLKMGLDPQSRVFLSFGGKPLIDSDEYELFDAMCSLLDIRLREIIREDMSGSYGVQVQGSLSAYPVPSYEIRIEFGCEPGREESLTKAVFEQILWMQGAPVPETYITKLRENFRRTREEGLKNNQYWMGQIITLMMREQSLDDISQDEADLVKINSSSMQEMSVKYLDTENYVKAFLMPKAAEN